MLVLSAAQAAPADARTCEVAFRLDDAVTLGALQLNIHYADAFGSFDAGPGGVACSGDAPNTLAPFVDFPADRIVVASLVTLTGMAGPRKLGHCWFIEGSTPLAAGSISVEVIEATLLDGSFTAHPRISVLLPDCGEPTTTTTSTTLTTTTLVADTTTSTTSSTITTTTSTTSTTLAECGDGVVEDLEECDDGDLEDGDGCDADCTSLVLCGDANGNDHLQSSDALLVLRAAIGQSVACPLPLCDTDGDTKLRTSDSLRVLKRAVGQSVVMACPASI